MMPRMMKPITAVTLIIEKTNSASPYLKGRVSQQVVFPQTDSPSDAEQIDGDNDWKKD